MRKLVPATGVTLVVAVLAPAQVQTATASSVGATSVYKRYRECRKTYTVKMDTRAARAVYRGTRRVTHANLHMLGRIEMCPRWRGARKFMRWYNHHQDKLHQERVWRKKHPPIQWQGPVVASWYDDGGSTACGFHATYGFASLSLPCGAQVKMRGPGGATVVATMQDRGPYVGGRTFDLNPALKAALGCGDICSVDYSG